MIYRSIKILTLIKELFEAEIFVKPANSDPWPIAQNRFYDRNLWINSWSIQIVVMQKYFRFKALIKVFLFKKYNIKIWGVAKNSKNLSGQLKKYFGAVPSFKSVKSFCISPLRLYWKFFFYSVRIYNGLRHVKKSVCVKNRVRKDSNLG